MISYLILCRSQSHAYRIMNLAIHAGYYAKVVRPPAGISAGGCSFAVKVPERQLSEILTLLKRNAVDAGKIYMYRPDGSFETVSD